MTTRLQLLETFQTTLDASGQGIIKDVGPKRPSEKWFIRNMHTQCLSENETRLIVTKGNNDTLVVASTYSGNQDDNDSLIILNMGETLKFKYTGGTPSSIALITLTGDRDLNIRQY